MKKARNISYLANFVLLFLLIFTVKYCRPEMPEPEVIVEYVEVEVPGKVDSIPSNPDPPQPLVITNTEKVIDSTWYNKYQDLKSEREKDSLLKEAITINEYVETYEDENIKIDVYTKNRGIMLDQNIPRYEIFPSTATVPQTTIIQPAPIKSHLYGGIQVGLPTDGSVDINVMGNLYFQNKKGNMFTLGADIQKNVYVGKVWKFF